MTRFFKVLFVTGLSSVYLMQAPCTFTGNGFSILPNISGLSLGSIFGGLGT